jgi:methyl-accepting chemotaxis protein
MDKLKEYIKTLVRELLDEESTSAGAGPYSTPFAFSKGQGQNAATKYALKLGYKLAKKPTTSKVVDYKKIFEMNIQDIVKQELLNEATYNQFKKDVKFRTKAEQLHKAMREVKKKINEIDRIVDYTQRMKQELSEGDGVQYWGRTEKAVAQISEMVNHLNNKINNLKQ